MTTVEANEQSVLDGGADETERALAHNVAEDGDRAPCFSARAAAEVLGELEAAGTSLARELSQLTTVWRVLDPIPALERGLFPSYYFGLRLSKNLSNSGRFLSCVLFLGAATSDLGGVV